MSVGHFQVLRYRCVFYLISVPVGLLVESRWEGLELRIGLFKISGIADRSGSHWDPRTSELLADWQTVAVQKMKP